MSKISIKPLADRVLVEPAAAETKTSSGIIFQILQKKNLKKELCCRWIWNQRQPNNCCSR